MLNQIFAGAAAASLAFCVYTAGWDTAHHGPADSGHAVAAADCCDTMAVGAEACTHCEEEAKHEAEMGLLAADILTPAAAPKGEDVKNTKCLISGETIGSMGGGISVEHKGKVYHLCCDGCASTFKKEPEKYVKLLTADPAKYGIKP